MTSDVWQDIEEGTDGSRAVWFHDHGVHVFPVHGKAPAVLKGTSWKDYRCTRQHAARFNNYGVPLSASLGVLDTDSRAGELWVLQQIVCGAIPDTPFLVETARGFHRYFQLAGILPPFLHRAGHTMEFRNEGQYVVGPGSVHPGDESAGIAPGRIYTALYWSWRWADLPFFPADFCFDDRPANERGSSSGEPFVLPEAVFESERHATLHKLMRSLVAHGVPLDSALTVCLIANRDHCRPPLSNLGELDSYLRRSYRRKDRDDFMRAPKTGWDLAASLVEIGLPVAAVLVAVRSVTPDFDPNTPDVSCDPEIRP